MDASTQQFIDIAGIKEGLVILNNGSYRLILSVSAINFSLKSEQEQNSLVFQYQSFLNSLHFPIQIVIQSKKLDLNQYLKKINKLKDQQKNELITIQTEDYIDFVGQLINMANIMKKSFFVIIGFDPIAIKSNSIIDKIFKKEQPAQLRVSDQEFKRYKEQIMERANVVATGLGGMGLHCVQLSTEEIIELFYKIYNPETADKERFTDANSITSAMVDQKDINDSNSTAESNSDEKNGEIVLDNSALVEEKYKQESQIKQREDAKTSEKQIIETSPSETPQPAQPAANPGVPQTQPITPSTITTTPPATPPAPPAATPPTNQQV